MVMKKSKVKSRKFKALLFAAFLSTFNSQLSTAWAQQAQAQQGQPLYAVNAKYVNGVAPGYWPTAGAGLTLNIAAGTAICGNLPVKVDYAGGTLTMTNAATNYVYLDPVASCVPAKNTTGFTAGVIPVAQVAAAGGVITGVTDVRTWFVDPNSYGPVCRADLMPGADAGAKIAAAIAALPATGGTLDARGLEGAQSIPTPLVINKPVRLLLGSATYTLPTSSDAIAATGFDVESDNMQIIGNGSTILQATRDWANGTFYGIGVFGFTGFVAEGLDIRITTTGAMPGTVQAVVGICVRGARTTYDPPSTNFRITNNRIWVRGAVTNTIVAKEAAIWIFGGSAALRAKGGLISGNVLDDSHGRGIYLYNAENVDVIGNPIRNLGATIPATGAATGIRVIGGYNVTVSSNPISMAGATGTIHGIRVEGDSANYGITLSGNSAINQVANDTLVTGMYVDNASRVTIPGNTLLNTAANTGTSFGLRFLTTGGPVSGVEVSGNSIAGWTQSQIRFSDAGPTDIHFAGNFLGLTNAGGAPLIDGLTEAQLAANRITTVGNVVEQQTAMTNRVPAQYVISTRRDAAQNIILDVGATVTQGQNLNWQDLGVTQWQLARLATSQNFQLSDAISGAIRFIFVPAGLSRINSAGATAVQFNLTNPSGTGGVAFGNGAGNIVATVSSAGLGTFNAGVTTPLQLASTVATGTAPLMVASITPVANLSLSGGAGSSVSVAKLSTPVNVVTFSATPTFNASLGNTQKITLTANVTSSTLSNATAGQTINFLICQDATGSRTFVWPTNVKGGMTIGSTLSTCSAQDFIFDGTNAYAVSSGVTNM
jgi:hypothetical protein